MLRLLKINNLALVEDLLWETGNGLIGITGETGAGKSVIVGALKLIVGERANQNLVRTGCDACSIEAVFDLEKAEPVNSVLQAAGLASCENNQLVIRRVIDTSSGNKQFVNCSPVTLSVLKQLGELLVDLHGPHDHQSLLSRERQLALLDAYTHATREATCCTKAYRRLNNLQTQYDELVNSERANEQEIDLLKHQIAEIENADLKPEEEQELERGYKVAANSSHLVETAGRITLALGGSDNSAISSLSEITRMIRDLEKNDPATVQFTGSFDTALIELEELESNIRDYAENLEVDATGMEALRDRVNLIETLKRKYGSDISEVLEFKDRADKKLMRIESRGEELEELSTQITTAKHELQLAARKLSAKRKRGAPKLAGKISSHLEELGFKRAHFEVALEQLDKPAQTGNENIEFMFSPNPGEPAKPLRIIASSGEMSRIMLAIKSTLANEDAVPILVFDEIDANVGGEIAQAVGAKMASLGNHHQVIAITHLPQVASLANCHYAVSKEFSSDGRTRSRLCKIENDERIDEIARMLGGNTTSARKHAENLLAIAA
jgi:DNA repair protein RecN (Recombination protein N)